MPIWGYAMHGTGCRWAGLRVSVGSPEDGSLGARIRAARLVPYLAVIGSREAAAGEVAVRLRDGRRIAPLPAARVVDDIGSRGAAPAGACGGGVWSLVLGAFP